LCSKVRVRYFSLALLVVAACSSQAAANGAAPSEAGDVAPGPPSDPGIPSQSSKTSAAADAATDAPAASTGSTPGDILGTLSGSCGAIKALLASAAPSLEKDELVFAMGEKYEKASLSTDGQRMFDTPNAGGSSTESEVMSLEVLRACESAKLLKTETEIAYAPPDNTGPPTITDLSVEIDGKKVGVSVTRAYRPQAQPFPDADVKSLLEKKLEGVNRSSQRVLPQDKWVKQILHVFAANKSQADAVVRVLPTIDAAIRADTIVLLTQTTGGGFVYCNPDPPLGSECP
jgi:hypothetical protein